MVDPTATRCALRARQGQKYICIVWSKQRSTGATEHVKLRSTRIDFVENFAVLMVGAFKEISLFTGSCSTVLWSRDESSRDQREQKLLKLMVLLQ